MAILMSGLVELTLSMELTLPGAIDSWSGCTPRYMFAPFLGAIPLLRRLSQRVLHRT